MRLTRAHLQDELLRIVANTGSTVVTIGEIAEVRLPRPRDRVALALDPLYMEYRTHVLEFLHRPQANSMRAVA